MGEQTIKLKKEITQYFSKWQKCWVYFADSFGNKYKPNEVEVKELTKFKYRLR